VPVSPAILASSRCCSTARRPSWARTPPSSALLGSSWLWCVWGFTPDEMMSVRPRLEAFAAQMLAGLPRRDQRATGELYVRGLMLDGQRKSMQPLAQRLGVDPQRLQQFTTPSTWDDAGVRRRLAEWAQVTIGPEAFVIDDVGFPKDGVDSPGVARMYSGALGKTGNCQIGGSVHLVTAGASAAVDGRLFIPESWDDTLLDDPAQAAVVRRRRARCKLGEQVRHREQWRLALDLLDEVTSAWGLPDQPVTADAGYGDITPSRPGLAERRLPGAARGRG